MTEVTIVDVRAAVAVDSGPAGLEVEVPDEYPKPAYVDLALRGGEWILFYTDAVPETVFDPYARVFELATVERETVQDLLLTVSDGPLEKAFIPTTVRQGDEVVWSSTENAIVCPDGSVESSYANAETIARVRSETPDAALPGPH